MPCVNSVKDLIPTDRLTKTPESHDSLVRFSRKTHLVAQLDTTYSPLGPQSVLANLGTRTRDFSGYRRSNFWDCMVTISNL